MLHINLTRKYELQMYKQICVNCIRALLFQLAEEIGSTTGTVVYVHMYIRRSERRSYGTGRLPLLDTGTRVRAAPKLKRIEFY